jgi:branched-chain amino acid transport system substrate-binding protein
MNNRIVWLLSLLMGVFLLATGAIPTLEAKAQEGECDDPLGCVVVAPGDPITLASALVIAGPNESLGTDSQHGVEIAIKDRGQVAGHDVELQAEDDGCSAEGGQTAATRIAANPDVVAVVGHSCSSSCTPAAPIYNDAGLTMISPSCTAPALTAAATHVPSLLRTAHNDNVQGRVMAEFVYNELGLTTAATIHDGSPYAEQLQQVFADVFEELGGTITAQEAVNVGDTDMRPVLTSIATDKPELIYYPIFIAEAGFITAQAKEVAGLEDTILAGADAMLSPDFLTAAGEASEGMYASGPDLAFTGEVYANFVTTYETDFGSQPTAAFHAHAYDAANMIFDAIEKVAQTDADGNTVIGRQALRDALYATSGFQGITGRLTCNENGDCANPKIAVNLIENGEFVPVYQGGGEPEAMSVEGITPIKIALLMPSTISDMAWSQSIYDSLKEIQAEAGEDVIEIAYTENMFNVTDAAAAIRDYADSGYNLVIAHGAQYGTSLKEIAPDFPETSFAWGTSTDTGEAEGITNIFAYEPRGDEAGYVTGALAAQLTEAKIIGLVGPVDAGDAKLHVDGFLAGVKDADPDIQVNVSFTGSFGDTALAAEAANTQIQAGADVLTGSSQQVVGAIGVAKEKGIPWIGVQSDQSPLAPDIVMATAVYDWRNTLIEMIKMHQAGELGGKVLQLTYGNGGIRTIYSDKLPAAAVDAAQAAEAGLMDGSITIVAEPR